MDAYYEKNEKVNLKQNVRKELLLVLRCQTDFSHVHKLRKCTDEK